VKIGILSDIHVDLNDTENGDVTTAICRTIEKENIDLFICAGDVADDFQRTIKTIEEIRTRSGRRCLFVPGNHDIWVEYHPEMNSRQIYKALQQLPDNLSNEPIALTGKWIAIGDLGWYDYSFGGAEYSKEEFDRMRFGDRVWQDGIKAVWNRDTLEQHRHFYDKLKAQLERHPDKQIIFVTHVLPIRDFTVLRPTAEWNYLNAFLGSEEYGDLVGRHGNVKYAISGHVHYRKRKRIGETEHICSCLGYTDQWKTGTDPFLEVPAAMTTIQI
jgi:putative phosphoesterase